MMKKLILAAGVFTSVVSSSLGETCGLCGKEIVVESLVPGVCIDCCRTHVFSVCKQCGRTVHWYLLKSDICADCYHLSLRWQKCTECKKRPMWYDGLCYACYKHIRENFPLCKNCMEQPGFPRRNGLCNDCWDASVYALCEECGWGRVLCPGYSKCKECFEKGPESLCPRCKEERRKYGKRICDKCYLEEQSHRENQ